MNTKAVLICATAVSLMACAACVSGNGKALPKKTAAEAPAQQSFQDGYGELKTKFRKLPAIDWDKINREVSSNVVSKIKDFEDRTKSSTHSLGSSEAYRLLRSQQRSDMLARTALLELLAAAIIKDEENYEAGRQKWHGAIASMKVDEENGKYTNFYRDGHSYTSGFISPDPLKAAKDYIRKLPKPPMTNGIPVRLQRARERAYQNAMIDMTTGSNVTVEVTAGGTKR